MIIGKDYPDSEERQAVESQLQFPVIGIGASVGGLIALQGLLGAMAPDCGMALVVVMHLPPDDQSSLGPLLQRLGTLAVVTVTQTTRIEPNHVYVIAPHLKLHMSDGQLQVSPFKTLTGRQQSIDLFFRSLAQAHRERSIGLVLSGTGSDGAQGLKRIKEMGGVAMAQSPEDAQFDSMPRAAIETGVVDFFLPVAEIPEKLKLLWANAKEIQLPHPPRTLRVHLPASEEELLAEEALLSIKALLKERTGHDFSHYKRATVLRRLERRMQVRAMPDLISYRRLLDADSGETAALLQDMLISVTNFFRDPLAFAALKRAVARSASAQDASSSFRAWVAGCATGEEAYSVAIVLREVPGQTPPSISIFASDIDQRAIAVARSGLYPTSIDADVSSKRLQGFFKMQANGWRVTKTLRDSVVFSAHNVLVDPPFTRMDLICCRNLMIYLDRHAQAQLLRSFHLALNPQGLLFLGSSETTDACPELFEPVDRNAHIYRATLVATSTHLLPPLTLRVPAMPAIAVATHDPAVLRAPLHMLHERVLRDYAPPSILVDADDTVLHVSERAHHLLRLPEGAPTSKLMSLARPELRAELRAAISRASLTRKTVATPVVQVPINGDLHHVTITARPASQITPPGLMLVVFDEAEESLARPPHELQGRHPIIDALEDELLRTQYTLHSMAGESNASTEELRAFNEELQTINEELHSTTEELETSREELQALNEKLTTVNAQLTLRIKETKKVNDDFRNLMMSAGMGAVFVDRNVLVQRFTPQAATLFNLLAADVGRPLTDIRNSLAYPQLAADISDVLRSLKRVDREIHSEDDRWFAAQVVPYRTDEDRIEGAVVALFDVTAHRATEDRLRASERRMTLVAESMRDYAIMTMDNDGVIETWSTGAQRIFGYDPQEVVGRHFDLIFVLEDRQAARPQEELRRARELGRCDDDRWHVCKDGQRIFCSGITSPLRDSAALGFAKIARDFTDVELRDRRRDSALASERETSERLQQANALKDQFLAVVSHELKNPLSVIQMNAQLISRLPGAAGDPRVLRSAHSIKSAVASQTQLINDLLELSRANMRKIVLAPAVVDMAELVRNVMDAAQVDAQHKGQTLLARLDSVVMFIDPIRIEQIVWNLVANAIKFTPPGGTVRIRLEADDVSVKLDVEDSGIGIDPTQLERVFELFRQVGNGSTHGSKGLGIGLALVKQLVELHHGTVQAISAGLGHGTTFTVKLPRAIADTRTTPVFDAPDRLDGLHLLLVDEDSEFLTAFSELLRQEGAIVETVRSATNAFERAQFQQFDAVVSNMDLSDRDGRWLVASLRAIKQTKQPRILAVSGMARKADLAQARAAGFDGLIEKPVDIDQFKIHLRATLSPL